MPFDSTNRCCNVKNRNATRNQVTAYASGQTIALDESHEAYKFLLSFGEGQEPWPAKADRPCLACYDFRQDPAKSMLETAAKAGALVGAMLTGADLRGINLAGANLQWINLEGAKLEEAMLNGADLKYSILRLAKLAGAKLEATDLKGADLAGADVTDTNFSNSKDCQNIYDLDLAICLQGNEPVGIDPTQQPMALAKTEYDKFNEELKDVQSTDDRLYAKLRRLKLRINSKDKVSAAKQKVTWLPKWVPNTTVVAIMVSADKDGFNAETRAAWYGNGIGGQACKAISNSLAFANCLIGRGSRENL
jgi:hypothetical protein